MSSLTRFGARIAVIWAIAYLIFALLLSPALVMVWLRPTLLTAGVALANLALFAGGAGALLDHLRSRPPTLAAGDRHRRTARRDLFLVLPMLAVGSVIFALLAREATVGRPDHWRTIEGRPFEMRGGYKLRMTKDGPWLHHVCRRRMWDCARTRDYKTLPRWPEPQHVIVRYSDDPSYGPRIHGLTVDGVVMIDAERAWREELRRRRVIAGAGLVAMLFLAVAAWLRLRAVIEHRRRPPEPPLPTLFSGGRSAARRPPSPASRA